MDSSKKQFKIDLLQVGTWFGENLISPLLQGIFAGTAHLLTLTLLLKYFPPKNQ